MAIRPRTSHGITYDEHLDLDTIEKGTEPPFEAWEGDHTALVHVLWSAEHDHLIARRPGTDQPLRRALFDRLFGEAKHPYADGLIDDLRAILDAHDPNLVADAPGAASLDRSTRTGSDPIDTLASMIFRSRWRAANTAVAIESAARQTTNEDGS